MDKASLVSPTFQTMKKSAPSHLPQSTQENNSTRRRLYNRAGDQSLRRTGFLTGMVVSMFLVLVAFNWKNYSLNEPTNDDFVYRWDDAEEEITPITVQRKEPELPKPKPNPTNQWTVVTEPTPVVPDPIPDPDPVVVAEPKPEGTIVIEGVDFVAEKVEENKIWAVVERMPVFKGCEHIVDDAERNACTTQRMYAALGDLQRYPQQAREMSMGGTVYLTFVVNEVGEVEGVEILKGVHGGKMLDKEAMRMVAALPDFIPGQQRMKNVKVRYNIPIKFMVK
jgi:protein TonB